MAGFSVSVGWLLLVGLAPARANDLGSAGPVSQTGPMPSETQRAQRLTDADKSGSGIDPGPTTTSRPVFDDAGSQAIVVKPVRQDGLHSMVGSISFTSPNHWLPRAEEVGMSDSETYALVDAHLDRLGRRPPRPRDGELPGILAAANRAGARWSDRSSGWTAWDEVLALHVEWISSLWEDHVSFEQRSMAYRLQFGHAPFEGSPPRMYSDPGGPLWWDTHAIPRVTEAVTTAALSLQQHYSEHPAAEFGMLYELDSMTEISSRDTDRDAAIKRGLEIVRSTEDRVVAEAAVKMLSSGAGVVLEDAEWATLDEALLEFPELKQSISLLGLDSALAEGDLRRANFWYESLSTAAPAQCDCKVGSRPTICESSCEPLEGAHGQLVALGALPPATWQEGVEASVVACTWSAGHPSENFDIVGEWNRGWQWDIEEGQSALGDCILFAEIRGPMPEPGQQVSVTVQPWF